MYFASTGDYLTKMVGEIQRIVLETK